VSICLPPSDEHETIERYTRRYREFGYGPKALGWDKGKQDIRFEVLTSQVDLSGKSVLDIGCGFGDLNRVLRHRYGDNYSYFGVDVVPDLIAEGRYHYPDRNIKFCVGDFLKLDISDKFDFAIASGIFNYKMQGVDNYALIEASIAKAIGLVKEGISFDFLSDKVDYKLDHAFHSAPEMVLSIAYKYSRNVILRNDYMPFEFSVFIFKDDSFLPEDTLFSRFKCALNR